MKPLAENPLRLLVVEDDEDDFQLLREACRRAGVPCVLEHYAGGIRTLGVLHMQHSLGHLPDLLICDLGLPDISGVELLERIRKTPALELLPVLIMTGSEAPDDRRSCASADHYFVKPRSLPEWTIITSLLHRYARRRAGSSLPPAMPSPTQQPPLILQVEDSEADRLLFARALSRSGLQAVLKQCESLHEARNFLGGTEGQRRPDLLVLDLGLPDGGGRELLMHIRGTEALRQLPVIVLTGSDSYRDIQDCRELLVIDYVTKPRSALQLDDFVASLRQWFHGALAQWLHP
jgi:CheY-like chemotaxis protein